MNARLAGDPPAAAKSGGSFFALDPVVAIAVIGVFVVVGLGVTGALLNRRLGG